MSYFYGYDEEKMTYRYIFFSNYSTNSGEGVTVYPTELINRYSGVGRFIKFTSRNQIQFDGLLFDDDLPNFKYKFEFWMFAVLKNNIKADRLIFTFDTDDGVLLSSYVDSSMELNRKFEIGDLYTTPEDISSFFIGVKILPKDGNTGNEFTLQYSISI